MRWWAWHGSGGPSGDALPRPTILSAPLTVNMQSGHSRRSSAATENAAGLRSREDTRKMRLRNFPCWVMGHMFRVKPGDKDMLVCQRCGVQELVWTKRMRDKASDHWS